MSLQKNIGTISPYPVVQIAWAVTDLDAAIQQWSTMCGAGPFFVMRHVPLINVKYRGAATIFDHSSAVAQWGAVQLELMQQHCSTPSHIRDIFPKGGGGFASVSWFVPDLAAETRRLEAMGFPLVWQCNIFDESMSALWFDSRHALGGMIEVFGEHPMMRDAYVRVERAAIDWNGDRPLRPMEELLA